VFAALTSDIFFYFLQRCNRSFVWPGHGVNAHLVRCATGKYESLSTPRYIWTDTPMDNFADSDQFIKSLLFAFLFSAVSIFVLQLTNLIDPDHLLGREGIAWFVATVVCTVEPLLRHQGILKGGIECRIGEFTKASALGRLIGAPAGCAFAWAITIIGS
jgi:hypothetical protein